MDKVEVGMETTTRVEVTKKVPGTVVVAAVVDGNLESVRISFGDGGHETSVIFIACGPDTQKLFLHLIDASREVLNECVDISIAHTSAENVDD